MKKIRISRKFLLCCALAACVQSHKVVCGDLTCPADYQCDVAASRCISPEQLEQFKQAEADMLANPVAIHERFRIAAMMKAREQGIE